MIDEVKNKEKATPPPASEEKPVEEETPEPSKEGKEELPEQNIDYKKQLEEEKARLSKAEFTIEQLKKEKKLKESDETYEGETGLTSEEIREEIDKRVKENITAFKRDIQKSNARNWAEQLSDSTEEKELMEFHYENTITPSGDIEKDMRRCKLLANESKITKELSEAKRALLSKDRTEQGSEAGQKLPAESTDKPPLSPEDKEFMKGVEGNVKWDPKLKLWVRFDKLSQSWVGPSGEKSNLPPPKKVVIR